MDNLTIAEALLKGTQQLSDYSDTSELDAQLLLLAVLDKPRTYLFTWPDRALKAEQLAQYLLLLDRRIKGEPVAFILGYQDFWTLRLLVSNATLIPRPDTELLVEQALELIGNKNVKVADLGCGTGAVGLALASERPLCKVVATDFILDAVALAQKNKQRLNIKNIEFRCGNWFEPLTESFDMIVSNPPYIVEDDEHLVKGDVRFEPLSALVSPKNGLQDIEHIINEAPSYLVNEGWLLLEHGYNQAKDVRALFAEKGFVKIETIQDLNQNDRVTLAQWC